MSGSQGPNYNPLIICCLGIQSFRNIIKSTGNQVVFTIFWLILIQTDLRLDPNQSENGEYNLISGWFNKISLCVAEVEKYWGGDRCRCRCMHTKYESLGAKSVHLNDSKLHTYMIDI